MSLGVALAILAGSLAGAFVSGVSGFAFGLVALSFWAWRLAPLLRGPMVVFGSIVTQATSLAPIWGRLGWPRLRPFLAGGVAPALAAPGKKPAGPGACRRMGPPREAETSRPEAQPQRMAHLPGRSRRRTNSAFL